LFLSLLKQTKWTKYKPNLPVGDVMLRRDKKSAWLTQKYMYTRVLKGHKGEERMVH
jgi:hypothetical protein